ncbi:MAG TPA: 6-phosphofructo-2-kinase/fructose-2,6-bisphosphatase [Polyangiales bacterium]|jgi:broad specificity phosphatase PhoE/predicted kinase|nr:6-phosphofructo-2-kinase/fructose-2,6-bisphosphatase [Polyangiales bacterium]
MPAKVAIVMVGLPARGKTYVARKLLGFLSWTGRRTRMFNAGDYRREMLGAQHSHEFFSPENAEGKAARLAVAKAALDDMFKWLRESGDVAIYDATNTTRARRDLIRERCAHERVQPFFVEIIATDEREVEATILETKVKTPDYASMSASEATQDFRNRIAHYASAYEPVGGDEGSFVKYIDKGRNLVLHRVDSELGQLLVRFLMNLRGTRKLTWLTRHGESQWNRSNLIGGDPDLSSSGQAFAERLSSYVADSEAMRGIVVWTSSLRRTVQTAKGIGAREHVMFRELDEIHAGVCEGMSYADIRQKLPEEAVARARDKFRYRYPRGESYQDLIERVLPVVLAYERELRPVLVVGHQAILRVLYSYLVGTPSEECPHISIPLHTLIALEPGIYDVSEKRIPLG